MKDAQEAQITQKEKKPLSKKDKTLLLIAGIGLAIALCCQGWYYWPWFGGKVVRVKACDWKPIEARHSDTNDLPMITNHSSYSKHDVMRYFRDIALRREDNSRIHTIYKWNAAINLFIEGNPAEEDFPVINEVLEYLNSIPNFPGIHEVSSKETADIVLRFTDGNNGGATGYFVVLSSDENDNLTKINIYIRNSLTREKKNSVIWEEILQSTGVMNDSLLTSDTLFYGGKEDLPYPSELDRTLLEMLYHPLIQSGMSYLHCLPIFWEYLK